MTSASCSAGLQVYKEVCSNCHSLKHVAFRDLTQLGYSAAQVKKFAADWGTKAKQFDPKTGDSTDRPNTPADYFPTVYYPGTGNPPDLSLITKARHDGPAYVYSLLTGYAGSASDCCSSSSPTRRCPTGCITTRISRTSTSRCRRR